MSRRAWIIALVLGAGLVLGPLAFNPALARLDLVLMKLGSPAFGGGFTLVPLIQREVVEQKTAVVGAAAAAVSILLL